MYLATLEIENFRIFGSRDEDSHLMVDLQPGLNLLVGENDSGKTCVVDAIRLLVGTVTQDYFTVRESDFHIGAAGQATQLTILGIFRGLNKGEAGALLEYLSVEGEDDESDFFLRMWLRAERNESQHLSARRRRVTYEVRAGSDDEGRRIEGAARDMLRATYLKPLRDALGELTARRGSRLSQVLRAFPGIQDETKDEWTPTTTDSQPKTLVEIMRRAEHEMRQAPVLQTATTTVNEQYLEPFSLGETPLHGDITVKAHDLRQILEWMELTLDDAVAGATRGLGIQNLLFIATELLALTPSSAWDPELPLLLIEEPEAHLEPQRQRRLIEFLGDNAKRLPTSPQHEMQIVLTTHSPNLASMIGVKGLIIMQRGRAYPMGPEHTLLDQSDYEFLERFLDVTKSNMFFARGVLIVEGDAEALLLPTLAQRIGRPLTKHGVSIVNVGHVGLFRYARIFRRQHPPNLAVRVACLADRDIPPDAAVDLLSSGRKTTRDYTEAEIEQHIKTLQANDGGPVMTGVSPCWTFEFDLAMTELAPYLHVAISLARAAKPTHNAFPIGEQAKSIIRKANQEYQQWIADGKSTEEIACRIYQPLHQRQASKTETAQALASVLERPHCRPNWDEERWRHILPDYLVRTIDHATAAPTSARNGDDDGHTDAPPSTN